jgi:hypothetical protein
MTVFRRIGNCVLACALGLANSCQVLSQAAPTAAAAGQEQARDGQHDFDYELGSWKIHLKRLVHPLTGSTTWVEFDGTSVTRNIWDGRGQIEEFETDGSSGHVEGLTLRLYNPQSRQWNLYWANSKDGVVDGPPQVGEFNHGRGEFFAQDTFNGRAILIRYFWSEITPNSAHFEQSFSEDGGKSWEVNWITDQTRVPGESAQAKPAPTAHTDSGMASATTAERDGQRDFDFNIGTWNTHIKRLAHPVTGTTSWIELNGTVTVHKVWNGRAQLEEIEADGPNGHWEGLTLFLYNPQSRQWSQIYADRKDGTLNTPSIGDFRNGRGELFDQETFHGRAVLSRAVWSDVMPDSHHFEEAFSDDGGKTWEANFVATLTRQKP